MVNDVRFQVVWTEKGVSSAVGDHRFFSNALEANDHAAKLPPLSSEGVWEVLRLDGDDLVRVAEQNQNY